MAAVTVRDPAEIRWTTGSVQIGYLGRHRWRVVRAPGEAESNDAPRELPATALVDELIGALQRLPRGGPVALAVRPDAITRDLGLVGFRAPEVHDAVRVVWREDLVGVLPEGLPLVDVCAVISGGAERASQMPFGEFAMLWLYRNAERCWAAGVPMPAERFGSEFSPARLEAATDRSVFARRLEDALEARLRVSPDPAETFDVALHELEALGHVPTFCDSDGSRTLWSSRDLIVAWQPDRAGGPGSCRVSLPLIG